MNVSIVIPWRDQASRRYAKHEVVKWYDANYPEAIIHLVDTIDMPFNLAACRNAGVMGAITADVVVIGDADTIPEKRALDAAIGACEDSGAVHLPYTEYRSLRQDGTREYLTGTPIEDCDHFVVPGACSGIYVTTPSTWWRHGGQDERFRGWGFEDAAWFIAHTTILGTEPIRHEGRVYTFHHDSQAKEGTQYEANAARCYHYMQAAGDIAAMRELVFDGAP